MALINELTNIGNAIREKTGGTELIPLKEMASAIKNIVSGQNPFEYAKAFQSMFYQSVFPESYELEIYAPNVTELSSMFWFAKGIEKLTLKGNNNGSVVNFLQFMRDCKSIVEVDLTNFIIKPSTIYMMFSGAPKIKIIKGEIDLTECTNVTKAFQNCISLEEIRFKQNSIGLSIGFPNSDKLSTTSVQSIFDGLATVETAQTLTLNVNTKILQSQVNSANAKGWTVAGGTVVSEEEYYG